MIKLNYKKVLVAFSAMLLCTGGWSQTTTYNYTGTMQTYVVPAGINLIQIEAWGAQGQGGNGGLGGYVSGELSVTPGETLNIFVGGQDGYNGGGIGWAASAKNGGGASDVRVGGTTLADRVIVAGGGGAGGPTDVGTHSGGAGGGGTVGPNYAGGGGGGGYGGPGGVGGLTGGTGNTTCHSGGAGGGGFTSGGTGSCNTCYSSTCGEDGTLGQGGNGDTWENGICYSSYNGTAGGGGGYYGGGGTSVGNCGSGGGGGGSSWTGSLANNVLTGGVKTGNGQIVITELCTGLITTVSSDSICEGEEVTLHAESAGTGVITWDGGITDGVAFTPSVGTTTYTATSSDPNDCPFVIDVFVGANPVVDAGSDLNLCEGEEATLNGSGTATDWTWDGGVTDGVSFTPPVGTTTYTLTGLIDSTGCSATDMVDVTYNEIDSTTTVSGFTYTANQSGAVYQWVECPGMTAISGATDQTFLPSQDGSYAVIIDLNGCIDTSDCKAILGMGVNNDALTIMTIYPNPTDGNFTVQLSEQLEGTIGVYATDGKLIYSEAINSRNTIDFSLKELENGIYIIQVQTSTENYSIRLIKE